MFPESESFDTPKPTKLIERMLRLASSKDESDIVLDFFAGSGTTAHSVMNVNIEDSGNRRFILVQLPEPLEVPLDNISTIADMTRERIRRASKRIKEENPLFAGDLGFRVFKLDSSNITAWTPNSGDLAQSLLEHLDHLDAGRTEADVLYELLLKLGLDLCVPIEHQTIAGKTVHSVGGGVLMACLDTSITVADAEPLALGIVAWHQQQAPAGDTTCVFRDSAFADDVAKSNLAAILEQHGIARVRSL